MQFRVEQDVMAQNRLTFGMCLLMSQIVSLQIMNVHSSRTLDVQFLDSGTVTSVKVSELREIPSRYLREMVSIPSQVLYGTSSGVC